ncbi:hypothetical protein ACLIA0_03620 [Bacillaceae bacterium W0354]
MAEEDRSTVFWIVLLTLGFLIGIILALLGPNIVHFVLFEYGDNFLISTPFISNILIGIATVVFCLGCAGMLFERKLIKGIAILLLITSLVLVYSGFTNYTIYSENDITIKTPLDKTVYQWSDAESATLSSVSGEQAESVFNVEIVFNDGFTSEVKINQSRESRKYSRLKNLLQDNGVKVDIIMD